MWTLKNRLLFSRSKRYAFLWACRTVGVPGCMALAAGYLLHLDPYGQLHWSSHDALVGLACAAPTALTGQSPTLSPTVVTF